MSASIFTKISQDYQHAQKLNDYIKQNLLSIVENRIDKPSFYLINCQKIAGMYMFFITLISNGNLTGSSVNETISTSQSKLNKVIAASEISQLKKTTDPKNVEKPNDNVLKNKIEVIAARDESQKLIKLYLELVKKRNSALSIPEVKALFATQPPVQQPSTRQLSSYNSNSTSYSDRYRYSGSHNSSYNGNNYVFRKSIPKKSSVKKNKSSPKSSPNRHSLKI